MGCPRCGGGNRSRNITTPSSVGGVRPGGIYYPGRPVTPSAGSVNTVPSNAIRDAIGGLRYVPPTKP